MESTHYNYGSAKRRRRGEDSAAIDLYMRHVRGDNSRDHARLLEKLRRAREVELTPRQQEMIALYFDEGLKMVQIAERLQVDESTVSRTIKRAKRRLYRCLQYGL